MKKQPYRIIKPFLLMAFSLLLITACYQPIIQKSALSLKPSVECRIIQHKFGETCVSLRPQRIIALEPESVLDPMLALGTKPIGYTAYHSKGKEYLPAISSDEVTGATNVGSPYQPSLEKILLLKPDLILAADYGNSRQIYELLSAIAPTVSVPVTEDKMVANKPFFKESLRYVAKIFGEEAKAEEVLSQYQKRIEELKKRLGNQSEQTEISVLFHTNNYIWTITKGVQPISPILTDLGLRHKVVIRGSGEFKNLSLETIGKYDSDILFIVDVDKRGSSFYYQHPIFSSLKAFKNNRVYFVNQEKWYTLGILGANKVLDDLFKYLPQDT